MALDVRLTTKQALALVEVVAWIESNPVGCDWWEGNDGHDFRVLRNAALRIGAGIVLDLPDDASSARARSIVLRELVKQLREIDAHG